MIKPKRLQRGQKIAIVSLSWGGLGDPEYIHKYRIAKARLENDFGLEVVTMPHALKGSAFISAHPELRAKDLMDAFEDPTISAVFCAIGGDDTIRLLPYIDYETIRNNPKIFMGYSDSTINHLMMYQAGMVSFYGPSIMCEFGEYVSMFDYTTEAVRDMLFGEWTEYQLKPSPVWSDDFILWDESNMKTACTLKPDDHGYEVICGKGIGSGNRSSAGTDIVQGHLLGGCLDVFMMVVGTSIWPTLAQWTGAILFLETSEDKPSPGFIKWTLRNLAAQGILKVLKGILFAKPQGEVYYEEYKTAILQVVVEEEQLHDLPIFYNVNFGHGKPVAIIPYGIQAELDCAKRTITFVENVTV